MHVKGERDAMAIELYCPECRSSCGLDEKKCPKCGAKFPRAGRKYRVCVSVKGTRKVRIVDNLTVAREVEGTIRSDLVREEFDITHHKVRKVVTLGGVWARYTPWARENKKSWLTDKGYYEKHLEPRFGKRALEEIAPLDIERMKSEMRKEESGRGKPYAMATIKHQIVLLRRLFNLARKWGMYDGANPVGLVQVPKLDNQKTEYLTEDELSRLMDTLESWPFKETAALVKFALLTGFRRGEVLKLTWDAVDLERRMVTLRSPKGGKTTTLPLSAQAIDVLRSLDVTSPYVFPGENGGQRPDFKGPWQRIRTAAGIPADFRFHGLRHHFASTLVSNGVDLGVVRDLLTHKHVGTTERYAHFAPDAVREAATKAGELLSGKRKTVTPLPVKGR